MERAGVPNVFSSYCISPIISISYLPVIYHDYAPEWLSGLRHCISVQDASLQSLARLWSSKGNRLSLPSVYGQTLHPNLSTLFCHLWPFHPVLHLNRIRNLSVLDCFVLEPVCQDPEPLSSGLFCSGTHLPGSGTSRGMNKNCHCLQFKNDNKSNFQCENLSDILRIDKCWAGPALRFAQHCSLYTIDQCVAIAVVRERSVPVSLTELE